ncbi:MAG TPA: HlyD family secretion protein [Candidatus Sulfotelmatobacter sp.]|nr:HlyD family secretion protein [Candidatus Sulfotelmatobacter sp.]
MSETPAQHSQHPPQHHRPWWTRKRVTYFIAAVIVALILGFLLWWLNYRSFIITNDSRIAADIVRVAPVGVGGAIEKVLVTEGDVVKAGQTVAEIDHTIPQAQYDRAKARFELAQIELDRSRGLVSGKYSPARELDNARTNYNIAGAELKLAEVSLQNTYLKSPIDGVVIQKPAEVGNILEPGQVAVVISDVDHAWVSANIEETKIAQVKPGQKVYISIDEGGSLTGRVQEITAATASQFSLIPAENAAGNYTKVVQKIPIKIVLDQHPEIRTLKAGQSVTVKIKVR